MNQPSLSSAETSAAQGGRSFGLRASILVLGMAIFLVTLWFVTADPDHQQLTITANQALRNRHYAEAKTLAEKILATQPDSEQALTVLGLSELALGNNESCVEFLLRLDPQNHNTPLTLYDAAERLFAQGRSRTAEQLFRRLLEIAPSDRRGNLQFVNLLRLGERNHEARPFLEELMKQRRFDVGLLFMLLAPDTRSNQPDDAQTLDTFLVNGDILSESVRALQLAKNDGETRANRVTKSLRGIVTETPENIEAQYYLGNQLLKTQDFKELRAWHARLPDSANQHAGIWYLRGNWARARKDLAGATRCFWESTRLQPDFQSANHQLNRALTELARPKDAEPFAQRSQLLAELAYLMVDITGNPALLEDLTEKLEQLGRVWEAVGWCHVANQMNSGHQVSWTEERLRRLEKELSDQLPLVQPQLNPAQQINLSEYRVPDWNQHLLVSAQTPAAMIPSNPIQLEDVALRSGIDFHYHNGANDQQVYAFEFSGGGMTVLDFDEDGWPDIYLTQGRPWPPDQPQPTFHDHLYRNLGNGSFENVSHSARLACQDFGQAATTADFNNDGFPDVYVANIGRNRLYQNNGDGTFTDISKEAGLSDDQWTLSCVVADLNGDTHADLYDVNYFGDEDVFTRICRDDGGQVQCPPTRFVGAQDQFLLSNSRGAFNNRTSETGFAFDDGKGMGVIAADFDHSGRLSLFVTNDMTPNGFFLNQTPQPGDLPQFKETALLAGVAFDTSGRANSCMGAAVHDLDDNQLLDIFVTNFYAESNNLFRQHAELLFEDGIEQSKMDVPSYSVEGWGTQFIDFDNDGFKDLVVANGHVDNYPHSQMFIPKAMQTQIFRHRGGGIFDELSAETLGQYFLQKDLGRAIARLDWNRDGREDFGVTHVHAPFALLSNETPVSGHALSIRLRGVASARDAIGSIVTLQARDKHWTQQLVAGDGYCASNQRQLIFGLGECIKVDKLVVQWPSGTKQHFTNLAVDCEILLVEGRSEAGILRSLEYPLESRSGNGFLK